jgi:ribosomal protein L11 methylase PrmA
MLIPILVIILAFVFAIICVPTIYAGIIGAPLVLTPKKAIREALQKIEAKKGEKLYELGAGTGRVLLIAEKEFGLETVGFELAPPIFWFAKINLHFNLAKKSKIFRLNAFNQDLKEADIVFCFLNVVPMEKLKNKFKKELKKGSRVVSYGFRIHGWNSEGVITGYPGNVYLYRI